MGRGTWIGIGVVIGIVAALALASILPSISPGTAEAMHLLRVSTVTMPIYAGTRTVTATATTTVTKYLGGKVITVTSTLTRTLTMYRTVTATPQLLTTTWVGAKMTLRWCDNYGCGPVAKLKVHNHTLYILIKTVYRTVTVGRVVKVPGTGVLLEDMNKIRTGTVLSNAREIIIVGAPVPPDWFSASHATKRIALISVRSLEAMIGYDLVMAIVNHVPPPIIENFAHKIVKSTIDEILGLESAGFSVEICRDVEPFHTINTFPTLIYTDKYVIGCVPTNIAVLPVFIANKSQFMAYLASHGAKPYECIGKTSLSYLEAQLNSLVSMILRAAGLK